jgi:spore cortex biosynthesis protein YabQ
MRFNKTVTFIGDLFFSILALLIIFYFAQRANYLELRFYLFLGSLLGLLAYLYFLSPYLTRIIRLLLEGVAKIIGSLLFLISIIGKGFYKSLSLLMAGPYGLLRWLGLLLFRIGEDLSKQSLTKARYFLTKKPKK